MTERDNPVAGFFIWLAANLIYALVIVPGALVLRALGRDPMRRARDAGPSYWIRRDGAAPSMTRQD